MPNHSHAQSSSPAVLVGIDVGGTFTDFVVMRNGSLTVHKVSTTPTDQSRGIVTGLLELGLLEKQYTPRTRQSNLHIVHGMTVATNALLERKGARTALLTSAGFADVLVIGRQNRPYLYKLSQSRPPLLVADGLRLEVAERLDFEGNTLVELDEAAVNELIDKLKAQHAESLAIVFLFSFRNPRHEQRAAQIIQSQLPDLAISLSSEILPEYREYERTATTVINAYVQPLVARYLARLENAFIQGERDSLDSAFHTPHATLRIMQSNGGAIGLAQAAQQAARLVLSGPAGGVVGAFKVAEQSISQSLHEITKLGDHKINLLTFDMGGTSTDVALCPGTIPTTSESTITGLPLRLPVIDIHTVGAGGGSIAYVDVGGALHVGPQSAGAVPGPACYGRGGTQPTVTDANLVLGRLDPGGFLGGSGDVALDVAAARNTLAQLAEQLNDQVNNKNPQSPVSNLQSPEQAALGMLRVANATMERALRHVSVERGHDPRQFVLLPFGGAGPLHACDLADALGIRRILVPLFPGVLSAYGMLAADIASDASQSVLAMAQSLLADLTPVQAAFADLDERVRSLLLEDGVVDPTVSAALDMRYKGQSYELTVDVSLPISDTSLQVAIDAFHNTHMQRYGYAMTGQEVEVVTMRVRGSAAGADVSLPLEANAGEDSSAALIGHKPVWFTGDAPINTPCYQREKLQPGNRIAGPAIVFQYDATTIIMPGWHGEVDGVKNIWLFKTEKSAVS